MISKDYTLGIDIGSTTVKIALLDKEGLIDLGITNESDLDFFLKLKDLKSKIWDENNFEKISTLKLFYELLNLTDYFNQISV